MTIYTTAIVMIVILQWFCTDLFYLINVGTFYILQYSIGNTSQKYSIWFSWRWWRFWLIKTSLLNWFNESWYFSSGVTVNNSECMCIIYLESHVLIRSEDNSETEFVNLSPWECCLLTSAYYKFTSVNYSLVNMGS